MNDYYKSHQFLIDHIQSNTSTVLNNELLAYNNSVNDMEIKNIIIFNLIIIQILF